MPTYEQVLVELAAKRARVATAQELRLRIRDRGADRIVPITSALHVSASPAPASPVVNPEK
jgi:hypothetical protein